MLCDHIPAESSSKGGKQMKLLIKKSSKLQVKRLREKGKFNLSCFCLFLKISSFYLCGFYD